MHHFPILKPYGSMEYERAMRALEDAGFTRYRPNWELVDDIYIAVYGATNPVGRVIAMDEAYYRFFGRKSQETTIPGAQAVAA